MNYISTLGLETASFDAQPIPIRPRALLEGSGHHAILLCARVHVEQVLPVPKRGSRTGRASRVHVLLGLESQPKVGVLDSSPNAPMF